MLEIWICKTTGVSLDASLEPFAHRRNVASLSLFYRYYFAKCSYELAELVQLLFSGGRSTRYSDGLHGTRFLDLTMMSVSTVSFLAQLDSGILCL